MKRDRKRLDFPLKVGNRINEDDDPKEGVEFGTTQNKKASKGLTFEALIKIPAMTYSPTKFP